MSGETRWRKLRAQVYRRDAGICQRCHRFAPLSGTAKQKAGHADHIKPRSHGGRDELHNLRWYCEGCNTARQNRELPPVISAAKKTAAPSVKASPRRKS